MTEPRGVTRDADTDPRHIFLTGKDVIARFGWGRTYGYAMLSSTGFPKAIGGRYRLDSLMGWEDRVLQGELPGRPDPRVSEDGTAAADRDQPSDAPASEEGRSTTAAHLAPVGPVNPVDHQETPSEAPQRRRTRGLRRAA